MIKPLQEGEEYKGISKIFQTELITKPTTTTTTTTTNT
jgi:hypothetical protein